MIEILIILSFAGLVLYFIKALVICITDWFPKNMQKWGGYTSTHDKLEYLLESIDHLEKENETLKDMINFNSNKIKEIPEAVEGNLINKVFVQKIAPDLVQYNFENNKKNKEK